MSKNVISWFNPAQHILKGILWSKLFYFINFLFVVFSTSDAERKVSPPSYLVHSKKMLPKYMVIGVGLFPEKAYLELNFSKLRYIVTAFFLGSVFWGRVCFDPSHYSATVND